MRVLLINIDSKIPNLALEKIKKYHLERGDDIYQDFYLSASIVDKIYVSCIFSWNKNKCKEWEGRAEIGGTGYDLKKTLPPEIENIKARINWGFTTRGCIRNCNFCVVPEKEGHIRIVGDIYDVWDGEAKEITLMDNNILALPEHFFKICEQIKKEKLRVDFNQGLDCRLLTNEIIKKLTEIRHKNYHFAFDNVNYETQVIKAIEKLKKAGINRSIWYIYCSGEKFEDALYRANLLRRLNQNGFIQRNETVRKDPKYILLARWVNQHHIFQTHTWREFLRATSSGKHRRDKIPVDLLNRN